jgi:polyhydroxyalkanoate synthesis regulator phasin
MPFLATQFRRMRVKVLHEGYNPEPEEKDSLVSFTTGLLRKLEDICSKTEHIKNKQKEVKETTNENLEKLRKDVEELKEEKDRRVSG